MEVLAFGYLRKNGTRKRSHRGIQRSILNPGIVCCIVGWKEKEKANLSEHWPFPLGYGLDAEHCLDFGQGLSLGGRENGKGEIDLVGILRLAFHDSGGSSCDLPAIILESQDGVHVIGFVEPEKLRQLGRLDRLAVLDCDFPVGIDFAALGRSAVEVPFLEFRSRDVGPAGRIRNLVLRLGRLGLDDGFRCHGFYPLLLGASLGS